jgi:RNA polymerase II subunit A C-terminal domain phosphatase SSU72
MTMSSSRLRVCCVCASNQNRSMEAHAALALRGYAVQSYGTGNCVKLPGLSADRPVVFKFGVPYEAMMAELQRKSADVYRNNGVLGMLSRNAKIKRAPEHWSQAAKEKFDIIITFEARVFEAVVDDFVSSRSPVVFSPAFVFNLEIRDTHSDAAAGARVAVDLVEQLDASEDIETDIYGIVKDIEVKLGHSVFVVPVFF